jgi:hypothetical protein
MKIILPELNESKIGYHYFFDRGTRKEFCYYFVFSNAGGYYENDISIEPYMKDNDSILLFLPENYISYKYRSMFTMIKKDYIKIKNFNKYLMLL